MRSGSIGDSKVAVLESAGGRPEIAGDAERTQNLLLQVVRGNYRLTKLPPKVPVRVRAVRTRRHSDAAR